MSADLAQRFGRRPTQKDVAVSAGVSQATVSIVLNHIEAASVPAATRARVRSAALALGYVPNRLAQGLRTARSMTLACVIPDITNPFYPGFVRGVQEVAGPAGYDVMIADTDGTEAGERRALAWLRQGRADGVAGTFFHLRAPELGELARLGIAVVRLENHAKAGGALPIDGVCIDNAEAAAALTRTLIARGHARIALIAGALGPGDQRVLGYTAAMRVAALKLDVVRAPDFTAEAGRRCMASLLRRRVRPSAVFGANDLLAIGAMSELRNAGLEIPEDVAVAGFDDIPAAALVMPALTTVRQHEQALGAAAARRLVARLAPGGMAGPGTTSCLPYEIIERASTSGVQR